MDDLEEWLDSSYVRAFRTACLVLRNRSDAEEAVQEAFLRVWRFRDSVPSGVGREAWLYRVVVNSCLSRLRADAARPRPGGDEDTLAALPSPEQGPAADAEAAARARDVAAALAALPEHLRVATVLRYYSHLSEKEIAVAIRRRPGTVKSRLHDARRLLARDPRLSAWVGATELEGSL